MELATNDPFKHEESADDADGYISSNLGNESDSEYNDDLVFDNIKATVVSGVSKDQLVQDDDSVASLDRLSQSNLDAGVSHTSLVYGFIPKGCYSHPIKSGALLGICHNPRYRQFLVLDAKGVTSWNYDAKTGPPVVRQLNYPSYQYRLYSNLVYDKKHNVYFCLGRDFSLKILNHRFQETYTVEANLRNVMFLLYNPKREELITGGVGGSKIWQFVQVVEDKGWTEVKAMSNYKLQHKYTLGNVGGGWVKKVTMDDNLGHLYCCSETDLHAYNLNTGDEIFSLTRAHDMSITGCLYSSSAQMIVTSSNDCTVKCWIVNGGLVNTFRVHTKAVTQIMVHPQAPSLVLTCSLDCSIKLLSLDTLNTLYSITVSSDGIQWMGLTHENLLWACTSRQVTMWNLNHFVHFFSLSRNNTKRMCLQSAPKKSTRLMTVGDDSCVRIFSPHQKRNLCNVLPMPCLSPLETVKCISYSRKLNLIYCLLNQSKLWIYTTRTDPACRIAYWDFKVIQETLINKDEGDQSEGAKKESLLRKASLHKAIGEIHINVEVCDCTTIATLDSNILLWGDEGWAGTVSSKFLLVGLTDGRVLFMDPFVRGLLHVDFRANKDAIRDIRHGKDTQQLLIQCDRNEVAIVQIFGLPTLQLQHELCLFQDIVTCTRMGDTVFYGYSDGAVSFHNLEEIDEDNINRRTNQIKNITELKQSQLVQKKFEHKDAIRSVDCCPRKRLFLSCGCDSVIKIWSVRDQCVIADVTLDNTLSCACFLNSTGDLVFGFLNNLYSISLNSLLPDLEEYGVSTYAESITAESDVYEDPAVTSEGVLPNLEPLDLSNYLKPYELDITKDFLEATDIVVRPQTREKEEEESEIMSNAPTDAYISDVSTPRLSRMDVFTPQSIQWDQLSSDNGHAQIMTKSETDVASPDVDKQLQFDRLDVTNPKHAEHFFPLFGDSPGGTPSVSSAETLSNSRSDLDDLSDFEFGTEYGSDNDDQPKVAAKKLSKQTKTVKSQQTNKQVLAKKKKVKKSELVLSFAPDDLSVPELVTKSALSSTKYGIDKMKIDVDALLKQGKKKKKVTVNVELSAPVEKESMEEKLANLQLRQSLQAGASELSSKKKKAASSRKRVPAASKKSSSSVKRTERDVQPVSQSSKASPSVTQQSVKKEKVNTVSGDIVSGLVPVALPTPPLPTSVPPKKNVAARTQRKGQIIDSKAPEYPSDMVKVPINENDRNPTQADEHEDDVDLSRYMDIDDDMECKSAASWNMATPDPGAKDSPGQSKTPSNLIQGPRVSSAQPERTKNRSSGMGSADSRIRVSVGLRTPLWSERMSDIDALSIQMDAYDDIVEGKAHGCFSNPLRLCNLTYTLLD